MHIPASEFPESLRFDKRDIGAHLPRAVTSPRAASLRNISELGSDIVTLLIGCAFAAEVPSSLVNAVSSSLAARYRPALCGDGSPANVRSASLNAAAAAPDDETLVAIRSL